MAKLFLFVAGLATMMTSGGWALGGKGGKFAVPGSALFSRAKHPLTKHVDDRLKGGGTGKRKFIYRVFYFSGGFGEVWKNLETPYTHIHVHATLFLSKLLCTRFLTMRGAIRAELARTSHALKRS